MRSDALTWALRRLGERTLGWIERMGFAARFSLAVLTHAPAALSLRRIQLTMREIYFSGVLSLVIFMVSGLLAGIALCLQGSDSLNKDGAGDSLSTLQNPVHTYQTRGTWTVTLVVSNTGGSATKVRSIVVTN